MTWFLASNAEMEVHSDPFSHLIIRNALEAPIAMSLQEAFARRIVEGRKIGKVGESDQLVYDAVNYTPTPRECWR